MASETNELTFVRCPTCRSLVPASAARCRICNAALAAESSNDASAETDAHARERHRTVSARPDEVEKMISGAGKGRDEDGESDTSVQKPDDDAFDPLGAFLEELDAEEPISNLANEVDSTFDDVLDGEIAFDEMPRDAVGDVAPAETSTGAKEGVNAGVDVSNEPDSRMDDRHLSNEKVSASSTQKVSSSQPQKTSTKGDKQVLRNVEGEKKRIDRERQKLAPRGVKPRFGGKPRREEHANRDTTKDSLRKQHAKKDTQMSTSRPSSNSSPNPPSPMQGDAERGIKHDGQSKESVKRVEAPREISPSAGSDRAEKRVLGLGHDAQKEEGPAVQSRAKVRNGRLFGWLISYENRDGRAIELRSGRFFITGTSIRDSDLILEDQSMSTPHALVSITERGLLIQDLMSERGTFVRSDGDVQYRREESVIEVKHGDWIRFGDVEFLVALVPE